MKQVKAISGQSADKPGLVFLRVPSSPQFFFCFSRCRRAPEG